MRKNLFWILPYQKTFAFHAHHARRFIQINSHTSNSWTLCSITRHPNSTNMHLCLVLDGRVHRDGWDPPTRHVVIAALTPDKCAFGIHRFAREVSFQITVHYCGAQEYIRLVRLGSARISRESWMIGRRVSSNGRATNENLQFLTEKCNLVKWSFYGRFWRHFVLSQTM